MTTTSPVRHVWLRGARELIRRRTALCAILGLALVVLAAPAALAQTTGSATLRGVIKDANGDIIPGATVTLTSQKTGLSRAGKATSEGVYVFAQIDPDTYTLKVEAANFNTYVVTDLTLAPADTRGQDVTLEAGVESNTVTVTAEQQVITETGEKAHTITASQIQNLSLIGRSSLELLRVLPGVVAPDGTNLQRTGFNTGANANNSYAVNGLRGENNNVSIDGSRVIDIGANNGTIITANNDFVQEVKVQVSNYAAEYGNSAVQISAVTKSGGKDFHGSLYDYWRPWQVAANDRSRTTTGLDRPHDRYQYPGGTISGPIIFPGTDFNKDRDKAFFFVGLEFQRQFVASDTRFGVVPTLKQRQGDFSEFTHGRFLQQEGIPKIPGGYDGAGTAIPNGDLSRYIDPTGQALINLFPQPTGLYANGLYNYATAAPAEIPRIDWKMRFDYRFNDKTSMFVRWGRESETLDYPYGIWWNASNYELPSNIQGSNLGRSLSVSVTSVISPKVVNEVVFSGSKLKLDNDYADPGKVSRSALGLDGFTLPFGVIADQAPLYIASWGQNLGTLWSPGVLPIFAYNDSFSVTDNLSWLVGAHNLKFGGLVEQANKKQNLQDFATGQVVLGGGWGNGSTGFDWGDLLTGRPAQLGQSTPSAVGHFRLYNYEFYGQDSWKVRPNLTLEYGMRVSYFPNNYERTGLGVLFDPAHYQPHAGAYIDGDPFHPNGILLASRGEIPLGVNDNPSVKFAPRAGFAWDVFGSSDTVVRGGAGVFYNRVQGNYQYGVITTAPNQLQFTADAYQYSGLTYSTFGDINPFSAVGGFSPTSQSPNGEEIPRIMTLSLSVSQRLPYDQVLEVAYVGTQGRHLAQTVHANEILPGTIFQNYSSDPILAAAYDGNAVNQLRPFPDFTNVDFRDYSGTSSYHSLQATLSRQLGQKVQYYLTYTFSKALGTLATNETGTTLSPIDTRGRQYGVLPFDRTHIFNSTYILQLPDGARGALNNWAGRGALNGWKVSGITTFQSGTPLGLTISGDYGTAQQLQGYFGTPNGGAAINYDANPLTGFDDIGQRILNGNALSLPGFGEEGTYQSQYYLRGPSRWNSDLTVFKTFGITESQNVEFRVGFFNVFNQAYANTGLGDVTLTVATQCNRRVTGVSNGVGGTVDICDPTGGYSITNKNEIGTINNKHGHRIIEFALKYNF